MPSDQFSEVHSGQLSDDLVIVIRHQDEQIFQRLYSLKVSLEKGRGLLQYIRIRLLKLA